jgi:hypothetical protein
MLSVRGLDDGRVAIGGIDATVAYCLHQVSDVLAQRESPDVQRRFYPDILAPGDARNAEWHRLMDGDLHHLFSTAGDILRRDLGGLRTSRTELVLPGSHLSAWMSALNQARIVLAELHGFQDRDMIREDLDPSDERDRALIQTHILGLLLQLLVEHTLGGMS